MMNQTVREFFASGRKGSFAQQLLRTYDDPCAGNFRLLRAVADNENRRLVEKVEGQAPGHRKLYFRQSFPMLAELDREMTGDDYSRLPREAAKED